VDDAKQRAMEQFGATAEYYVASKSHQAGDDLPRMIELAQPRSTDRLLDIATGGGNVARVFSPHVGEIVASDLTPRMLAAVEASFAKLGLTNVTIAEADAEQLPFEDGSFDIVTCRIAPHHFPHPDRFVLETARVLRPGGRFLLVDSTVPPGEVGEFWNRFEMMRDPSHVRTLTTDEWSALIRESGLELHAVEDYPKRHEFADWVGRADVPGAGIDGLLATIRDAGEAVQSHARTEWDGDQLVAFTDIKTLFFATKLA
jgi:ubiquinone/menaquinone biosynthesis C-methylase UbiE